MIWQNPSHKYWPYQRLYAPGSNCDNTVNIIRSHKELYFHEFYLVAYSIHHDFCNAYETDEYFTYAVTYNLWLIYEIIRSELWYANGIFFKFSIEQHAIDLNIVVGHTFMKIKWCVYKYNVFQMIDSIKLKRVIKPMRKKIPHLRIDNQLLLN